MASGASKTACGRHAYEMVKTEGFWRVDQVSNAFWPGIRAESRARLVVLSNLCLNVAPVGAEPTGEVEAPDSSRYAVPVGPRKSRVTTTLRVDVVHRYRAGQSSREVADGCGIAKSTVLQILRSEGVEVRQWGVRY